MTTSDSPIQMPARKFEADQKGHRSNNTAIESFGNVSSYSFIPIGGLVPYAGATAPPGYLECDGSAVSRQVYGALFSVIGTAYGTGDGTSTFNIPTATQAAAVFGQGVGHTHGGVTTGGGSTASGTGLGAALGIILIRTGAQ